MHSVLQLFKIIWEALKDYHYSVRCMLEFYGIFSVLFTVLAEWGLLFIQECVLRKHIKITLLLQRCLLSKLMLIDVKFYFCMVSISISTLKACAQKLLLSCISIVLLELTYCKCMADIFLACRQRHRWKSGEKEEGKNQCILQSLYAIFFSHM